MNTKNIKYPQLRVVQVTYQGGDVITTSMNGTPYRQRN